MVLQAMARTPIGHLDPLYVELMGEVQELLRYTWQTDNRLTLPMSGTGSAAMEATLANTVEAGDTVLVAVKGYFGLRLADMAGRYRANVVTIERPWGEAFNLEEIEAALKQHRPAILAMVHAETSTGICQPMDGVGDLCRQYNCLLLLDTVTSLGAVPKGIGWDLTGHLSMLNIAIKEYVGLLAYRLYGEAQAEPTVK